MLKIKIRRRTARRMQLNRTNLLRIMETQAAMRASPVMITVNPPPGMKELTIIR
jgi:hypothetical protein